MENIISRILEIDREEQELMRAAETVKEEAEANISKIKADMKAEYMKKARDRVARNMQMMKAERDSEIKKCADEFMQKRHALLSSSRGKMDSWVETVYRRALNFEG